MRDRATSIAAEMRLGECESPFIHAHPDDEVFATAAATAALSDAGWHVALRAWAQLRPADGPTLNFEFEREYKRPVWPSEPGAQNSTQHLDIHVDDLEASVAWAIEQGAVLADFQPQDEVRVLLDPDGHPFCLWH